MVYIFMLNIFIIFAYYGSCRCELKDLKKDSGTSNEFFRSNCSETFKKPTNNVCSVSYLLYTENNRNSPCYIEPDNQEYDQCEFDPRRETKILVHGYTIKLKPGNIFERIKDNLLEIDAYNVIIVNWTLYNQGKYGKAVDNAYLTGIEVGKFINFLINKKGASPADFHLIGHSLGAHVCGVAGKKVPNLGRISGVDPAAPNYKLNVTYNRLTDSDAGFVDVMHCSNGVIANGKKGYGIPCPIGQINFYPNGGIYQPACKLGVKYVNADADTFIIKSNQDFISCRHETCIIYFWHSILDCEFLSFECDSYKRFNMGGCFSHSRNLMGFYAEKIPSLPNHSEYYLNTTSEPPYCGE